jgi:hypothetical protein
VLDTKLGGQNTSQTLGEAPSTRIPKVAQEAQKKIEKQNTWLGEDATCFFFISSFTRACDCYLKIYVI